MKDDQERIEIFKVLFPHPPGGAVPPADGLLAGMLVDPRLLSRTPAKNGQGMEKRSLEGRTRPFFCIPPSLSPSEDGNPGGPP
jgi:hypothetical protein